MPIEGLAHFYFNVFHILLYKGRCWQCKLRSPVYMATSVFRQPDEGCGWLMLLLLRFDVRAGCSIRNIRGAQLRHDSGIRRHIFLSIRCSLSSVCA